MDPRGATVDCSALRGRIAELETTLSTTKQAIPATPTNQSDFDSTRTNSVIKLVEALNRAAHEVETPKPWPRTGPTSVCKDTPGAHLATLAAIDQTIQRYNTKKVLTSTASTLQYQQRIPDKKRTESDANVQSVSQRPDKVTELVTKLEAKEKQIIFLTTENLQLKSKVSKLKHQIKVLDANAEISPVDKENHLNGASNELSLTQASSDLNNKIARELTSRIDELRTEAEEKLTAAAIHVDELQQQLDAKSTESKFQQEEIERLRLKLIEFTDSLSQPPTTITPRASKRAHTPPKSSIESASLSSSAEEEIVSLKKKLSDLTKVYNESCQAQSTMKATMGQAVEKLRQFITELEEKNKQLAQARKENDGLKSRLSVLERGTFLPFSAVLNAEMRAGNSADGAEGFNMSVNHAIDQSTVGVNSSCILANSYERTTLAALNAMSDEHFLLNATQEEHHRMAYLRQAFLRMFQSKDSLNANEMMNLGRVICSLLSVDATAQSEIVDSIGRMASAANVSTGILNVFSIFD